MMKPRFVIYYVPTGMGLVTDAQILHSVLSRLGFEVRIEVVPAEIYYPRWQQWLLDFSRKINFIAIYKKPGKWLRVKSDVYAIHLENIIYKKCFLKQNHILIPNQEWFEPRNQMLLPAMQSVWCKTRCAENIFRELGARTTYIGFASQVHKSCYGLPKQKNYFFSRVGKSRHRGAELLIRLWTQHPEWPTLKMVIHKDRFPEAYPANVECIGSPETDEDYHRLASSSLLHIYMTETEGFGHSIVEAMGYGCVLLVTDAPPMNEVTNKETALLVGSTYSGQKRFSPLFAPLPQAVEANIERVLNMTDEELERFSIAASARYLELQRDFEIRLGEVIDGITKCTG
jgi:glycosyltransferase involved in cell wall biosynthesis